MLSMQRSSQEVPNFLPTLSFLPSLNWVASQVMPLVQSSTAKVKFHIGLYMTATNVVMTSVRFINKLITNYRNNQHMDTLSDICPLIRCNLTFFHILSIICSIEESLKITGAVALNSLIIPPTPPVLLAIIS